MSAASPTPPLENGAKTWKQHQGGGGKEGRKEEEEEEAGNILLLDAQGLTAAFCNFLQTIHKPNLYMYICTTLRCFLVT